MPSNSFDLPQILAILCVIKVIRPDLYEAARTDNLSLAKLDELMHLSRWRDRYDPEKGDQVGEQIENWWRYALGELSDQELAARYERDLAQYNVHPSRIITYFCEIIDGFSFPTSVTANVVGPIGLDPPRR
jgi:hypothetical protein